MIVSNRRLLVSSYLISAKNGDKNEKNTDDHVKPYYVDHMRMQFKKSHIYH
ncbi:hypothetical protein CUS_6878 [Ruminococcus albus 8]|uniref:Uncharacterized protein n=1 Tax=Ruminococcus albus 8 TaxID=246199 RepID=E9SC61_RUMAL|nr:hypothetical protein CUS_6878 [Ruminococcus albus 8]